MLATPMSPASRSSERGRRSKATTSRSSHSTCGNCSPTIPTAATAHREDVGIYYDYSKNRLTDETLQLLLRLAEASGLRQRIDAMFSGEKINVTEDRAVLHVALAGPTR